MDYLKIKGCKKLNGSVRISGAKNGTKQIIFLLSILLVVGSLQIFIYEIGIKKLYVPLGNSIFGGLIATFGTELLKKMDGYFDTSGKIKFK